MNDKNSKHFLFTNSLAIFQKVKNLFFITLVYQNVENNVLDLITLIRARIK